MIALSLFIWLMRDIQSKLRITEAAAKSALTQTVAELKDAHDHLDKLKLAVLESNQEKIHAELERLSYNIHALANAMTPYIAHIDLMGRPPDLSK